MVLGTLKQLARWFLALPWAPPVSPTPALACQGLLSHPAPPWQLGTHLWSVFVHLCGHSHRNQFSAALPLLCQSWPVCCHFSLFHEQFTLLKRNYSRWKDWYADLWTLLRERLSHLRYTRTKALDKEKVIISWSWRDNWEIKCQKKKKKNVKQLI